jgi:hypothetical protein
MTLLEQRLQELEEAAAELNRLRAGQAGNVIELERVIQATALFTRTSVDQTMAWLALHDVAKAKLWAGKAVENASTLAGLCDRIKSPDSKES